jgi:hypothetical protein
MKNVVLGHASLIGAKRNVVKLKLNKRNCGTGSSAGAARTGVAAGAPGTGARVDRRLTQYNTQYNTSLDAVFFGDVNTFIAKLGLTAGADGSLVCRGTPAVAVDITFFPEINEYNGMRKVQLIIRSVRKAV